MSTLFSATTRYGHVDLLGEQHVLAGLRHRAVDRAHDQDAAVHLGGARDHVLDVVGVARAVDVGVVPVRRRVLDVARGDRENLRLVTTALRSGRLGDLVVETNFAQPLSAATLVSAAVSVVLPWSMCPIVPDVDVRFRPIELLLRHVPLRVELSALSVGYQTRPP
jgi:hypothetical protein